MDTPTPSLSDPTPTSRRTISYYVGVFVFLVALLGGILWYVNKTNKQAGPAFDPTRQFVPKGTAPLNVGESLAVFNFPKPLPFFEERNVVQSLSVDINAPASTTNSSVSSVPKARVARATSTLLRTPPPRDSHYTFLSYRIFGQDKETVQTSFIGYFNEMGWKMASTSGEGKPLLFSSNTRQNVSVVLLRIPSVQGTDQSAIVAALIVR